jgi:hypothetical protein
MATVETAKVPVAVHAGGDERRAKAMEEHRRLVKEHRDKENKLRDCTLGGGD